MPAQDAAPEPPPSSILFTTVASQDDGRGLARLLVERRAAACVQLLPIESVYRWDGAVQEATEVLLLIKAPTSSVADVEAIVAAEHPYDTPELIYVSAAGGLPAYLEWLVSSTEPESAAPGG